MTNHPNRHRQYIVQYQQFGVTDIEHFCDHAVAMARYDTLCVDADTALAWVFYGPSADADCVAEYQRAT